MNQEKERRGVCNRAGGSQAARGSHRGPKITPASAGETGTNQGRINPKLHQAEAAERLCVSKQGLQERKINKRCDSQLRGAVVPENGANIEAKQALPGPQSEWRLWPALLNAYTVPCAAAYGSEVGSRVGLLGLEARL